jgi:amino acid adenylation domain-containing protein
MPNEFPLTDLQQAYWAGRRDSVELGGVAIHFYYEFECVDLDIERLAQAWDGVLKRHAMLRAIITPEARLKILDNHLNYSIPVLDLDVPDPGLQTAQLDLIRSRLSHRNTTGERWPLFAIQATHLGNGHYRLHLSFDGLVTDFRSHFQILDEWRHYYQTPDVDLPLPHSEFSEFVEARLATKSTAIFARDREYWSRLLLDIPPAPDLPLTTDPARLALPSFERITVRIDRSQWSSLKENAKEFGVRPSRLLLAIFAEVLRLYSTSSEFSLNVSVVDNLGRQPRFQNTVGSFGSTTLVFAKSDDGEGFRDRAVTLQRRLGESLAHSSYSGVALARELSRLRGTKVKAQFPVVFTGLLGLDARFENEAPGSWLGDCVYAITQTPQVMLDLQTRELDGELILNFDYVRDLFPSGLMKDLARSCASLLETLADGHKAWYASQPGLAKQILPRSQLAVIEGLNCDPVPAPQGLLHDGFVRWAHTRPSLISIRATDRCLTYKELLVLSRRIAAWLGRHKAHPNQPIAIVMRNGWEQIVATLGILQSGAPYLPVDADLPEERIRFILEHAGIDTALTQTEVERSIDWPRDISLLSINDSTLDALHEDEVSVDARPSDLAYVIYTSGSTGKPKGVMIEHQAALNTIEDINARFHVGPQDRILALSSLSFDLSVYDIFGALSAGGTIVVPEISARRDPSRWLTLLKEEQITIWNSVPALMQLLVEYAGKRSLSRALRLVMLSGDWIPVDLPHRIKGLAPCAQIVSLGGATEASIWSILWTGEHVEPGWPSIPYGSPMDNQCWHILNDSMAACPLWVPGHLYIGGAGVARGYWQDEPLTHSSFVDHPLSGVRLFRTGDLGRLLPDGNIEILGREDLQVKINGYRVEPTEIECVLEQHPDVRSAIIKVSGAERSERHLMAFIVPASSSFTDTDALREYLTLKLPDYMIPEQINLIETIPLTPNGKVDRGALRSQGVRTQYNGPVLDDESKGLLTDLMDIVEVVADYRPDSPETNLMSLGINSIAIIRILNRVEDKLGTRPGIDDFLQDLSVSGLLRLCRKMPDRGSPASTTRMPKGAVTLRDPAERDVFREKQISLRQFDEHRSIERLSPPIPTTRLRTRALQRRSYRHFDERPIAVEDLGALLENLRQLQVGARPKRLYGSAGGLYPVQTYIFVKSERVNRLDGAAYYYDPACHALVCVSNGEHITADLYDRLTNRPIFEEAAFAVYFFVDMHAIEPAYGARSLHYGSIEAGLMTQILEEAAPNHGIGLCQIGDLNFTAMKTDFLLGANHHFVHSLLGGKRCAEP